MDKFESTVIQKMSELIIRYTFPDELSGNKICDFVRAIINNLFEL